MPSHPGQDPPSFTDIVEGLNTAVILVDENLLISTLNPAAENLLGISRRQARSQPFLIFVDDDKGFAEILGKTLSTQISHASELSLAASEAHPNDRTIETRTSVILGEAGARYLLVEMTDVTRRLQISRENALLIQHGAGRQMIRQLAHEIKNPLGGLRGAAQLLARQLPSTELQEFTDVIISEADRLASLVDTLLGPGGPPKKEHENVHELLEYVLRLLEPERGNKVHLVREQIIQALINVVQNALHALEGQGQIIIRTRAIMNFTIGDTRHPVVATIDIEDNGPGVPLPLQDSIFYPLVTSRADGTGLGLPVAQELLSRHGGLIEFDSRPGRTVFSMRIPLATAPPNDVRR